MSCLLPAPSLPRRLLRCPFEPIVLTLTLSLILSIWSTNVLLVSNSDSRIDYPSVTPASTSTVTVSSTDIISTISTPTTTLQALNKVNDSAIKTIIDDYSRYRLDNINEWINAQVSDPMCEEWKRSLKQWNDSLNLAMETKTNGYNSFLAFKNSLSIQFQQDSARINETLDLLSQTALTVGSLNSQELAQNLTVEYWTIDDLFANYSSDMIKVKQVFEDVQTPEISCPSFSLKLANISAEIAKVADNLTAALHNISRSNNSSISAADKRINLKASVAAERQVQVPNELHKRCRLLTLITCIVYLVVVIFLCVHEMLKFRLEKSMFNLHIADMLDQNFIPDRSDCDRIKGQQELRSKTDNLTFSIQEPVVQKISAILYSSRGNLGPDWPRLTTVVWWIWSSGRVFWILLFYTIIHCQMLLSIFQVHRDMTVESSPTPVNRSVSEEMQGVNLTYDPKAIYLATLEVCQDFEDDFNKVLAASVETYLTDSINSQIDTINSKMVSQKTPFDTISWENITARENLNFPPSNSSNDGINFNYAILEEAIQPSVSVTGATQLLNVKTPGKEVQNKRKNGYITKSWQPIYKWTLIALMAAAMVHHLLGSIISLRL